MVGFLDEAELAGEVPARQPRAVALDDRRCVREPRGQRRDAGADEVVHVLRPREELLARELALHQRAEEAARAGLPALEVDALVEEFARGEQPIRRGGHALF